MKKMLVLLLPMILLTGCIFDSGDDDNDIINDLSAYFPLTINHEWTRTATVAPGDAEPETFVDTVTQASTLEGDDHEFYIVESTQTGAHQSWYRIEGDTIYRVFSGMVGSAHINWVVGYLKCGISPGTSFVIDDGTVSEVSPVMTGTYLGKETVTIPYGTCKDCAKYMIVSHPVGDTGSATTTTLWLGRDVGVVKEIMVDSDTTTTTVLEAYGEGLLPS